MLGLLGAKCAVLRFVVLVLVVLSASIWWFLLDARAPGEAANLFDVDVYRLLIEDDEDLPTAVRVELVGQDSAPRFAGEAGGGFSQWPLYYTAFQIVSPITTTVIGGAVDDLTAVEISQSPNASFDAEAYARLSASYRTADQIYITHEHVDHVMAITRAKAPEAFADKLRLTTAQIEALPRFAPPGQDLARVLKELTPFDITDPTRIAPGVVVAPAAGHSPGSLVFFVRRNDGAEYLFIGDIVWLMTNIENLSTRPRLLQYMFFSPPEDRETVLAQVRALHDLAKAEPGLTIVADHDGGHIDGLIEAGLLEAQFE